MFLFGKPSADIIYIMCKIYHENIIRILTKNRTSSVYNDNMVTMMCGLLQLSDVLALPMVFS